MDDLTLIAPTSEILQQMLHLLQQYSDTWQISFAPPPKSACAHFGKQSPSDPSTFQLGDLILETQQELVILGTVFTTNKKSHQHAEHRFHKARGSWFFLRNSGMLGGPLSLTEQSLLINSIIIQSWNHDSHAMPPLKPDKKKRQTLLNKIMRHMLGCDFEACIPAMLGELGWFNAEQSITWSIINFENSLLGSTDPWSLIFNKPQANSIKLLKTFTTLRNNINFHLSPTTPKSEWSKPAKALYLQIVLQQWKKDLQKHPSLWLYDMHKTSLSPPLYTNIPYFPGRCVLTRVRINNIQFTSLFFLPSTSPTFPNPTLSCPRCKAHFPITYNSPQHNYQLAYHSFIQCPNQKTLFNNFITQANRWLAHNWNQLSWDKQLADLLLFNIHPSSPQHAPEATGAFLLASYQALNQAVALRRSTFQ